MLLPETTLIMMATDVPAFWRIAYSDTDFATSEDAPIWGGSVRPLALAPHADRWVSMVGNAFDSDGLEDDDGTLLNDDDGVLLMEI